MSEKMVVTSSMGDSSREEEGEEWLLRLQEVTSFKKCKKKDQDDPELLFLVDL